MAYIYYMSTHKKIAIISAVFPPYKGGIGNVAQNHARILGARGCDVMVFTPNYSNTAPQNHPLTPSLVKDGELVLLKPVFKYGNAAYVPQLARQLRDYDTVILEYPFFGGMRAVYRAKKKYGFKLILFYHMDTVASGLKGLVFKYAKKFFLPKIVKIADTVVASSQDYAKHSDLGRYWRNDDPKFKVLRIGVDVSKFKPSETDEEFRKNMNIKPDEKIILFVGGLDKAHYFKGVEYLIKSIPFIRHSERGEAEVKNLVNDAQASTTRSFAGAQDDGYKIVIVGRGELQAEYRERAEKLGVKDKVMFTGGISDEYLLKLYQMAYVFVLPSIDQSEAFGIVLVEAMACACPVIASDLPGVRSVFENGKTGFVSKVRDEKDLADKISFILNNEQKRFEMSQKCVQLVAQKYNWDKIGDRLLGMVNDKYQNPNVK